MLEQVLRKKDRCFYDSARDTGLVRSRDKHTGLVVHNRSNGRGAVGELRKVAGAVDPIPSTDNQPCHADHACMCVA